ncbi:2-succinyl-5-enolpyruvyl-6-hydroxy-3-cyclohexene-1-carboxylic-acid synthase [Myxococcota bacterium]|nr:2-succinyl-5-enolpyruvyl-6-hydroxy-3-cyclohexene-1-carboxylic-acid synthase [Myxococcota bacterium]
MSQSAPTPSDSHANHRFATELVGALRDAGVRHVCVCPGSRSAPLTVAWVRQSGMRCWSHLDERSAGFFGLGLSRALGEPVALVCTSGTAAANFHPAVIEAHYSRVPLIVLTADRPPELREWGAGQTIDQVRLYGPHVRWFAETAPPDASEACLRHARALALRAVSVSTSAPAGPVHLNLPFREPLDPPPLEPTDPVSTNPASPAERPLTDPLRLPAPSDVDALANCARQRRRGVIRAGPLDAAPGFGRVVADLARITGWPILAEPTSQLRRGPHTTDAPIIASSDLFLRDEALSTRLAPEVVLQLGDAPTSKAQRLWLEGTPSAQRIHVDPDGVWHDPSHQAWRFVRADPLTLCSNLLEALQSTGFERVKDGWLEEWLAVEERSQAAVARVLEQDTGLLEPRAVREIASSCPDDAILYVSNSMPVRDLDSFLPVGADPLRILCNRGANGIDGVTSSALGAAAAGVAPVLLLTGDLAFIHDVGGLLTAARNGVRATIVVFDNDGGGIFSYLPIARHGESVAFEEHFRTPHGIDLAPVAQSLGANAIRVESTQHLRAELKAAWDKTGTSVLVVPVDRERSLAQHREITRAVALANASPNPPRTEA